MLPGKYINLVLSGRRKLKTLRTDIRLAFFQINIKNNWRGDFKTCF